MMTNLKQQAALHALKYVQDGMLLGLGTGSTTAYFIELLGEKLRTGELHGITGVPTSEETIRRARRAGIPLTSLSERFPGPEPPWLDLVVDGADEIDPDLNLIKGLGRALLREKVIEMHARRFVVIADESKVVERLGRGPLPVEILPFEHQVQVRWLNTLGCRAELWLELDGSLVVTDNGNYLARCWFENGIPDPYALARALADRPGVIEHGLFLDMGSLAVVASPDGIKLMERG
jgi:ribose 5-phosphate isomerase A